MFPGEHVYRRMSVQELQSNLSLLQDMFPNVESDVCQIILQANQGYIPATIEALLDISKSSPTEATSDEAFGSFSSIPETVVNDTTQGDQGVSVLSGSPQTRAGLSVPAPTELLRSGHGRHTSVGSMTSEKVLQEAGEASSEDVASLVPTKQPQKDVQMTVSEEDLTNSMAGVHVGDAADNQPSRKPKDEQSPKP
ncbi:hypothetical protein IWQ62_002062 [Dispira parvispora]|uniref:CUE domain-containing protein n=1 Tax=Dispira parvispora TaxID=1520584 RepID=A0A9W8E343_9FUNG|nr:hypothetical protein IWQ62_002062 [Dispira parvispora]